MAMFITRVINIFAVPFRAAHKTFAESDIFLTGELEKVQFEERNPACWRALTQYRCSKFSQIARHAAPRRAPVGRWKVAGTHFDVSLTVGIKLHIYLGIGRECEDY